MSEVPLCLPRAVCVLEADFFLPSSSPFSSLFELASFFSPSESFFYSFRTAGPDPLYHRDELQGCLAQTNHPPLQDPTAALYRGSYGGPRGGGCFL